MQLLHPSMLLLLMWQEGVLSSRVQIGKRQRGVQDGPRMSLETIGPLHTVNSVVVDAFKSSAAIVLGELCGKVVEMMLDYGSLVFLVQYTGEFHISNCFGQ